MKHGIRKTIIGALAVSLSAMVALACPASAQETPRNIGDEIVLAGTYCPRGTLPADGRLISIEQNLDLFALLGTTHGGDGRVTFALPDRRLAQRTARDRHRVLLSRCVVATPSAQQPGEYLSEVVSAPGQCPQGTVPADGRLLQINNNQGLFSLLGTTYDGNGVENFGLPDLREELRNYCVFVAGLFPSRD